MDRYIEVILLLIVLILGLTVTSAIVYESKVKLNYEFYKQKTRLMAYKVLLPIYDDNLEYLSKIVNGEFNNTSLKNILTNLEFNRCNVYITVIYNSSIYKYSVIRGKFNYSEVVSLPFYMHDKWGIIICKIEADI